MSEEYLAPENHTPTGSYLLSDTHRSGKNAPRYKLVSASIESVDKEKIRQQFKRFSNTPILEPPPFIDGMIVGYNSQLKAAYGIKKIWRTAGKYYLLGGGIDESMHNSQFQKNSFQLFPGVCTVRNFEGDIRFQKQVFKRLSHLNRPIGAIVLTVDGKLFPCFRKASDKLADFHLWLIATTTDNIVETEDKDLIESIQYAGRQVLTSTGLSYRPPSYWVVS